MAHPNIICLRIIKKIFNKTVSLIKEISPQQVILIDYPGFNMRLAKKVKKLGVSVTYFILPQVWAWNSKRAEQLKKDREFRKKQQKDKPKSHAFF